MKSNAVENLTRCPGKVASETLCWVSVDLWCVLGRAVWCNLSLRAKILQQYRHHHHHRHHFRSCVFIPIADLSMLSRAHNTTLPLLHAASGTSLLFIDLLIYLFTSLLYYGLIHDVHSAVKSKRKLEKSTKTKNMRSRRHHFCSFAWKLFKTVGCHWSRDREVAGSTLTCCIAVSICLCHQPVLCVASQWVAMLCTSEANRRSGVTLAMHHRLC